MNGDFLLEFSGPPGQLSPEDRAVFDGLVDAAAASAHQAADLIDPFTAIGGNMSPIVRLLSTVSIGAMTTAGTSTSGTYLQTRPACTIPVRAILNSVAVDVVADASVTVVVMEPVWRNTDKVITSTTVALAAGDGRTVDLGKLVALPGTRIFVRVNSGAVRFDAAAAVWRIAWAGFSTVAGSTGTMAYSTGALGMVVNYSPLVDEIDTNASASAAIARMSDPLNLRDITAATGTVPTPSIASSADAGTHIAAGSIITGWSAATMAIPNDGTQAEALILALYEKTTSAGDIDTTGAFQNAGRPVRIVRKTCADLGLIAGADAIPIDIAMMPYIVQAGKTYTAVLMGDGGAAAGKFVIATSGTAGLQRRRGWWVPGAGNDYSGLADSSFAAGLTYTRERAAGDPPSGAAIAAWDAATIALSAAVMARRVTGLQQPTADYNLKLVTGQSIAAGALTRYALSTTPLFNNKMLGGNVRPALEDGSTYTTFGPAVWNNMVAVPKYGAALYTNEDVDAYPGAQGEPWNLAFLNSAKAAFNEHMMVENDARIFCTINSAISSKTIEQLSKVNAQDATYRWNVLVDGFTKAKTASGASSIRLTCVLFGQGENDYAIGTGSVNRTRALWKAKAATYFDDIQAEAASRFGQAKPAAILTYQTSGPFVVETDANGDPDLFVSMAQLELSNERADTFMVGPAVYPYPELVTTWHQTANAARWFGEQAAKVYARVTYQQLDWKPVQPLWIRKFGSEVYIGFHVPVAPLVFDDPYFTSDFPSGYPFDQRGFKVIDRGNGNAAVAATVTLAGKSIVKLQLAGDTSDDLLILAGPKSPVNNGNGHVCLRDSDPAVGTTGYVYDADYMDTAERLDERAGQPYPLWNWCVVGSWPVGYTAPFIEWGDEAVSGSANALSAGSTASGARVRNADYTAYDGDVIEADTSGGPWTLTLPPLGGTVIVRDYAGTWATNNLTIAGVVLCTTSDIEVTLIRQGAETDWRWTIANIERAGA